MSMKCTEATPFADACFGDCENGAADRPLQHVCYGSCPSNTRLCDTNTGLVCLDNDLDCVEYAVDLTVYILDWVTNAMSGNVVGLVAQAAGEHPDLDYPQCSDW